MCCIANVARLPTRAGRIAAWLKGPSVAIAAPDVITRYFAAQAARDFDTLLTLFAADAVVIDEGRTRRGAIRELEIYQKVPDFVKAIDQEIEVLRSRLKSSSEDA